MKKITSWSYSRYSDYKDCPKKAYFKHVLKLKEPPSPHLDRGTAVHKQAEDFIKGEIEAIPESLKLFKDLFFTLRNFYSMRDDDSESLCSVLPPKVFLEESYGFDKDWKKCAWDDWGNCVLRVKIDCLELDFENNIAKIYDWKTGKFRENFSDTNSSYMEQLELYALATMLIYPAIQKVTPYLCYLDSGQKYPNFQLSYDREDIAKLKYNWHTRTRKMLSDEEFKPKCSTKCQWCFFDCEFANKEGRK